jgi:hypothetical protein
MIKLHVFYSAILHYLSSESKSYADGDLFVLSQDGILDVSGLRNRVWAKLLEDAKIHGRNIQDAMNFTCLSILGREEVET